jgi:hypothetical protein
MLVQLIPNAVEDVSVWKNSDIKIWLNDVVELAVLLVPEEGVRHPDLSRISHGQVFDAT